MNADKGTVILWAGVADLTAGAVLGLWALFSASSIALAIAGGAVALSGIVLVVLGWRLRVGPNGRSI